jgi:hypothetical protein
MDPDNTSRSSSILDNPTFIAAAIALAAVPLSLSLSQLEFEADIRTNFQNFIEWFGVPYALVLAAVLVNAWQQFETVERDFDKEADALATLFETSLLLDDRDGRLRQVTGLKAQIKEQIVKYVEHVSKNYRDEPFKKPLRKEGDRILTAIRLLIPQVIQLRQELLARELLRLLNEAQDLRGDRIAESKQRIKKQLSMLSLIASIVWLFPFYALHFRIADFPPTLLDRLNYVMAVLLGPGLIVGVTFVVVSMLFIIRDLNDPFTGSWALELDSWTSLQEELES